MEGPTLNEQLEILKITKQSVLLSDGSIYKFMPTDLPKKQWDAGDNVVVSDKYEGERFESIYRLKNESKDDDTVKAGFERKIENIPLEKNLSSELLLDSSLKAGNKTPTLDAELRITDITGDYIELENNDRYKIVRELTLKSLNGWQKGQYVKVSKSKLGYEMWNPRTKNSARVTFLIGEKTE